MAEYSHGYGCEQEITVLSLGCATDFLCDFGQATLCALANNTISISRGVVRIHSLMFVRRLDTIVMGPYKHLEKQSTFATMCISLTKDFFAGSFSSMLVMNKSTL